MIEGYGRRAAGRAQARKGGGVRGHRAQPVEPGDDAAASVPNRRHGGRLRARTEFPQPRYFFLIFFLFFFCIPSAVAFLGSK